MRPARRTGSAGPQATGGDPTSFGAFVARHDALTQQRVAVVAHAERVAGFTLFAHHRVALQRAWGGLAPRHETDRITTSSLLLVRSASSLATGDGPGSPTVSRDALDAARCLAPAWRHPDPWTLLAPRAMRALRALVHLDAPARDLAILQWLGVPPASAAGELGVDEDEYRRRRDDAMAFWAHVVREAGG